LLDSSPEVRLETAPGGHLGVLTGMAARHATWRHIDEFLVEHDPVHAEGAPAERPAAAEAS
jgi:polyhydroxyalkanoate synthase